MKSEMVQTNLKATSIAFNDEKCDQKNVMCTVHSQDWEWYEQGISWIQCSQHFKTQLYINLTIMIYLTMSLFYLSIKYENFV